MTLRLPIVLRSLLVIVLAALLPLRAGAQARTDTPPAGNAPALAAASDLKFALEDVAAAYRHDTRGDVRLTFGSSGNFARQIEQGAPFELFFSADEGFVETLAKKGLTRDSGALYGVGRIVIFAPNGSPLVPDPQLANLRKLLARPELTKLAIANPEHAPYGRAAQQALTALGLWDDVKPKLVLGENIAQAAQFATTGNAVGGIIAYSLALAPDLRDKGRFVLLPENLHQPLRQKMVLLKGATPAAERFYVYVQSAPARAILKRYGFTLPGE